MELATTAEDECATIRGTVSQPRKTAQVRKVEGTCAYCGAPAEHWDHVIPVFKGGSDTPENLVSACARCNLSKSSKGILQFLFYHKMPSTKVPKGQPKPRADNSWSPRRITCLTCGVDLVGTLRLYCHVHKHTDKGFKYRGRPTADGKPRDPYHWKNFEDPPLEPL